MLQSVSSPTSNKTSRAARRSPQDKAAALLLYRKLILARRAEEKI